MRADAGRLSYKPESKEDLLSSSGFKTLPLKTLAQIASFKKLPARRLSQTVFKGSCRFSFHVAWGSAFRGWLVAID